MNERLDQRLLSAPRVLPDLRRVQNDLTVDNARGVPTVDDALGALNDVELLVEIVVLEDGPRLEFFRDALLPRARPFDVSAPMDVFASAGRVETAVNHGAGGRVIA